MFCMKSIYQVFSAATEKAAKNKQINRAKSGTRFNALRNIDKPKQIKDVAAKLTFALFVLARKLKRRTPPIAISIITPNHPSMM